MPSAFEVTCFSSCNLPIQVKSQIGLGDPKGSRTPSISLSKVYLYKGHLSLIDLGRRRSLFWDNSSSLHSVCLAVSGFWHMPRVRSYGAHAHASTLMMMMIWGSASLASPSSSFGWHWTSIATWVAHAQLKKERAPSQKVWAKTRLRMACPKQTRLYFICRTCNLKKYVRLWTLEIWHIKCTWFQCKHETLLYSIWRH